ncbi:hypothetical protein P170DRAFT_270796 [Aspergillus steynii IBT 23096]|uniref:Uncharacterized protein n=1 Tax=Aspergillus steynii IBT 23096 TaxID=1392250 RepID=A0A2I2FWF0_9EURO|nr:uncharacterized protein P170DRAFT_270796 [Aspergillus steynii IBT 23096]PLB44961.1 hypothetical protein P170DRAFT_270796 [Aspergillus steynii IBT 23096]
MECVGCSSYYEKKKKNSVKSFRTFRIFIIITKFAICLTTNSYVLDHSPHREMGSFSWFQISKFLEQVSKAHKNDLAANK